MKKQIIGLSEAHGYPKLLLDYLADQSGSLQPFYKQPPTLEGLRKAAVERQFPKERREVLVERLKSTNYHHEAAQIDNIELLNDERTITITTGHQLNLATGPLYFIYKIISTIRLCEIFNSETTVYKAVPVYWMASEDHDLEEISSFYLFGKTYTWNGQQKGPVGRMDAPGEDFWGQIPDCPDWLQACYSNSKNLAEAHAKLVSHIFGKYGLLILEPDDHVLKSSFASVMRDELFNSFAQPCLKSKNEELEALGYEPQINGREINLFYMSDGQRERILKTPNGFSLADTNVQMSHDFIKEVLNTQPECLSPNVVLRPVYQEFILPNIAYVGGPAEISYWLQLKAVFEKSNTPFPVLWPRNFSTLINPVMLQKTKKLNLEPAQLFKPLSQIKKQWLESQTGNTLDFKRESELFIELYGLLKTKSEQVDASLAGWVESEKARTEKQLEMIQKRLLKALESKEEQQLQQIEKLLEKLFPQGGLQERKENVLNYLINKSDLIQELIENLDPREFGMHLIYFDHE